MTEDLIVLSTLMTIVAKEFEEGTKVANSANLNCSIVEMIDTEDNRVEITVESSDMLVGL